MYEIIVVGAGHAGCVPRRWTGLQERLRRPLLRRRSFIVQERGHLSAPLLPAGRKTRTGRRKA